MWSPSATKDQMGRCVRVSSHKFSRVHVSSGPGNLAHTHTCRGNRTFKHVVHGRDSPSSHACSYQQGSLMMSHFNDVTASDLWLAPIPCLSGCAGGYIDCSGVNACMVRLAVILCWSAVVISEIKILRFTETSHTFSVALGLFLLWQFAKGDKTATYYRHVC